MECRCYCCVTPRWVWLSLCMPTCKTSAGKGFAWQPISSAKFASRSRSLGREFNLILLQSQASQQKQRAPGRRMKRLPQRSHGFQPARLHTGSVPGRCRVGAGPPAACSPAARRAAARQGCRQSRGARQPSSHCFLSAFSVARVGVSVSRLAESHAAFSGERGSCRRCQQPRSQSAQESHCWHLC